MFRLPTRYSTIGCTQWIQPQVSAIKKKSDNPQKKKCPSTLWWWREIERERERERDRERKREREREREREGEGEGEGKGEREGERDRGREGGINYSSVVAKSSINFLNEMRLNWFKMNIFHSNLNYQRIQKTSDLSESLRDMRPQFIQGSQPSRRPPVSTIDPPVLSRSRTWVSALLHCGKG